ncbi:hypothetical protein BC332_23960 [Capsicum chinense]|nr:hypothetical protein BC332_23960 [Capsicum chinense]
MDTTLTPHLLPYPSIMALPKEIAMAEANPSNRDRSRENRSIGHSSTQHSRRPRHIWLGFYTVKLAKQESQASILHGDLWFVPGSFISARKWEPNFVPSESKVDSTAIWIRLPHLPTKLYDASISQRIGTKAKENDDSGWQTVTFNKKKKSTISQPPSKDTSIVKVKTFDVASGKFLNPNPLVKAQAKPSTSSTLGLIKTGPAQKQASSHKPTENGPPTTTDSGPNPHQA